MVVKGREKGALAVQRERVQKRKANEENEFFSSGPEDLEIWVKAGG